MDDVEPKPARSSTTLVIGIIAVVLLLMFALPVVVIIGLTVLGNSLDSKFEEIEQQVGQ